MLSPEAETFIKYNFTITQDLCKQFITVVSGILVFSLTFSEKIVNFTSASRPLRALLGLSWACMLFAIIACGLGLSYICIAGGQAVYGHDDSFLTTQSTSYMWIIAAGAAFVIGLVCLICVALARTFVRERAAS
jgi:Mn2+/Fe2+ NRAMP family transporter